jgi:hypothetical protein
MTDWQQRFMCLHILGIIQGRPERSELMVGQVVGSREGVILTKTCCSRPRTNTVTQVENTCGRRTWGRTVPRSHQGNTQQYLLWRTMTHYGPCVTIPDPSRVGEEAMSKWYTHDMVLSTSVWPRPFLMCSMSLEDGFKKQPKRWWKRCNRSL